MHAFLLVLLAAASLENGSFTLDAGGRTIHYEVRGRGPVLMTVPNSWGLSLEGLRAMYRPLEARLTMVYFDPRGMGASSPAREETDLGPDAVREDFHALRKHLGLEKVAAIGWSNGATNLILLAAEAPDAIETAVFLHGIASFGAEDGKLIAERYPDLMKAFGDFEKEMAETADEDARNARVKTFDTEVWFPYMYADPEEAKKALPEAFRDAEFSWEHAQYTNRVWPTLDLMDRLASIRARSLVIAGRHDMLPPEEAQEIAKGIAGDSKFVVFEESGHFSPLEETERFVETVTSFLTR